MGHGAGNLCHWRLVNAMSECKGPFLFCVFPLIVSLATGNCVFLLSFSLCTCQKRISFPKSNLPTPPFRIPPSAITSPRLDRKFADILVLKAHLLFTTLFKHLLKSGATP